MKNWFEPVRVIATWTALVMSVLFVMAAVVLFPVVLSKLTGCWWWLLSYGCYVMVLWFLYEVFVE